MSVFYGTAAGTRAVNRVRARILEFRGSYWAPCFRGPRRWSRASLDCMGRESMSSPTSCFRGPARLAGQKQSPEGRESMAPAFSPPECYQKQFMLPPPLHFPHHRLNLLRQLPGGPVLRRLAGPVAVPFPLKQAGKLLKDGVQGGRGLRRQTHLLDVFAVGPRRLEAQQLPPVQQRQHRQVERPYRLQMLLLAGLLVGLAPPARPRGARSAADRGARSCAGPISRRTIGFREDGGPFLREAMNITAPTSSTANASPAASTSPTWPQPGTAPGPISAEWPCGCPGRRPSGPSRRRPSSFLCRRRASSGPCRPRAARRAAGRPTAATAS